MLRLFLFISILKCLSLNPINLISTKYFPGRNLSILNFPSASVTVPVNTEESTDDRTTTLAYSTFSLELATKTLPSTVPPANPSPPCLPCE